MKTENHNIINGIISLLLGIFGFIFVIISYPDGWYWSVVIGFPSILITLYGFYYLLNYKEVLDKK